MQDTELEQRLGTAHSSGLSSASLQGQMCSQLGKLTPLSGQGMGPGHTRFLSPSVCAVAVPGGVAARCSPAPLSRSVRRGGAAEGRHGRERLPDGVLDRALLLLPLGHADLTPLPPRRSPSAMQAPHSCPDFFLLL